jgi:hypothetical protein
MLEMGRSVDEFRAERREPERLSRLTALLFTTALSLGLWLVTVFALQYFFN